MNLAPDRRRSGAPHRRRRGARVLKIDHGLPPIAHRLLDRRDDVGIGAAAADVAAHQLADLVGGLRLAFGDQAGRRADLARRAVAALERVVVDERLLQRMQRAVRARPSMVVTCAPSFMTASVRQELTRRPSTSTVQAPHWPWSQPFLVPVRSRCSRSASSRVVHANGVCSPRRTRDHALAVEIRDGLGSAPAKISAIARRSRGPGHV
jgi:hypothetical protein